MGILDEAIREHLELKRKQGAEQSELRQLEDEAFGPSSRPEAGEAGGEVEAPDAAVEEPETTVAPAASAPADTAAEQVEEAPAGTDEPLDREAIARQPTEVFDVASELARESREQEQVERPPEAEEEGASERSSGADEVEAAGDAPRPPQRIETPPPPPPPVDAEPEPMGEAQEEEEQDIEPAEPAAAGDESAEPEIFDEQSLSEELDQALDAPTEAERRKPAFFEETDEFQTPQRPRRQPIDAPDPSDTSEQDVLEETPDFLEETPEHDRLWFEQKPPKDFDFND